MLFHKNFPWHFSSEKLILGQNQDEAIASSRLMLATALTRIYISPNVICHLCFCFQKD